MMPSSRLNYFALVTMICATNPRYSFVISHSSPQLSPFAVDFFGKNDPYCIMILQAGLSAKQKWRSKTHQEGGKAPRWNENHTFQVVEGDDRLQIQVGQSRVQPHLFEFDSSLQCYDEDNGSDDFIGSVTVHLNQVYAQGY